MPRFVVHYQNGAVNGRFCFVDASTPKDAERYARRDLEGFTITRTDYAARWLSKREERLSNSLSDGVRSPEQTRSLLTSLRALQDDYLEAYGPSEAKRIERLMALARRAVGQKVMIPPPERLCLEGSNRHITDGYMQADYDPTVPKGKRRRKQ